MASEYDKAALAAFGPGLANIFQNWGAQRQNMKQFQAQLAHNRMLEENRQEESAREYKLRAEEAKSILAWRKIQRETDEFDLQEREDFMTGLGAWAEQHGLQPAAPTAQPMPTDAMGATMALDRTTPKLTDVPTTPTAQLGAGGAPATIQRTTPTAGAPGAGAGGFGPMGPTTEQFTSWVATRPTGEQAQLIKWVPDLFLPMSVEAKFDYLTMEHVQTGIPLPPGLEKYQGWVDTERDWYLRGGEADVAGPEADIHHSESVTTLNRIDIETRDEMNKARIEGLRAGTELSEAQAEKLRQPAEEEMSLENLLHYLETGEMPAEPGAAPQAKGAAPAGEPGKLPPLGEGAVMPTSENVEKAIKDATAAGFSPEHIGKRLKMSPQEVEQVIKGGEDKSAPATKEKPDSVTESIAKTYSLAELMLAYSRNEISASEFLKATSDPSYVPSGKGKWKIERTTTLPGIDTPGEGSLPETPAKPENIEMGGGVVGDTPEAQTWAAAVFGHHCLEQIGTEYVWGGEALGEGVDCSGIVWAIINEEYGIEIPRTAKTMAETKYGTDVAYEDLRFGDLVFYHTTRPGISHMGIYVGDGQMVQASSAKGKVIVQDMEEYAYKSGFVKGLRLNFYELSRPTS